MRLDKDEETAILRANDSLALEALRVLGFAYKRDAGDSSKWIRIPRPPGHDRSSAKRSEGEHTEDAGMQG